MILADDCVPEFLLALDGRLYYVNPRRGGEIESIAPDGSDRQVLVDESCDWMQIYDGELYFCDGEAQFWHMQPDGSGKTLLLQGPCCICNRHNSRNNRDINPLCQSLI